MLHGVSTDRRTDGSVVSFWLVALLGPVAAALVVRAFTDSLSPLVSTVVVGAAMPAPLIAAIVAGHRRWPEICGSIRRGFEAPRALLVLPALVLLVWVISAVALTAAAGNVAGIDGVGRIATDTDDVRATIAEVLDADAAAAADVPPVPVLVLAGLVGGIIAGLTVNGVLAFGEEYGWRGYLWDRLRGRGRSATILGIGTLWGLWHAPLILIVGLNYPDQRIAGVAAMVLFAVAASWPLDELRRASDSPVAPAVLHGAINGSAGVLLLVIGGDRLWAAPTGLLGALAFIPAGAVAKWARTRTTRPPVAQRRPR